MSLRDDISEQLPSYVAACQLNAARGSNTTPDRLPPRASITETNQDLDDASSSQPPPFSITPGTLILEPHSVLIHGPVAGARPLYQLTRPLNGHVSATCLIDMPATRPLREDGTLRTIRPRDELYAVQKPRLPSSSQAKDVLVTSRQRDGQFEEVRLRKGVRVGLAGLGSHYEACSDAENRHSRVLYHASQRKKGVLEWHDGGGTLVAVERLGEAARAEGQTLEVMIPLDKMYLDLLVALWIARIYQDTQEQGEREEKQDAKQRKADQKQRDKEEGRPAGLLHDVKEALGIGYGLNANSLMVKRLYGGFPNLKDNGKIDWGAR